jgi:hypothetical protein
MDVIDEERQLARAQMAMDAMAIGHALLDSDADEARFRTHLVHGVASRHGFVQIAAAANGVSRLLSRSEVTVIPGIGRALLALLGAIDRV